MSCVRVRSATGHDIEQAEPDQESSQVAEAAE